MSIDTMLESLVSLYQELPEVACRGCGLCCVSPTCTLAEFIYLMRYCLGRFSDNALRAFIAAPPSMHPDHEGNLRCPLLDNNRCSAHEGRTAGCRTFGIPSLTEIGPANMTVCRQGIAVVSGRSDAAFLRDWIDRLFALSGSLHAFGVEPYFVKGFNLPCWLEIYFDPTLDAGVFVEIKNAMNRFIDLERFRDAHRPSTGLKEKIDMITLAHTLVGTGDRAVIQEAFMSIRDDFPLTGTYYLEEADLYLKELESTTQANP